MAERRCYILLISIILFCYGSFNVLLACQDNEPLYLIWTAFCYVAVLGLLMKKTWSQYLVYLIALFTSVGWAYFTAFMAMNGWPYYQTPDIAILFALGAMLIVVSVSVSVYVYKYFKGFQL